MWGHREDEWGLKRGDGQGEGEEAANLGWSLCVKTPGHRDKAPNGALTGKSPGIVEGAVQG